jgi:tetratricopeptide (TPR) repeat protein
VSVPPIIVEIDRAMRAGNTGEAARLAERALGQGLSHPILYSLRAQARRRSGQLAAALEDLNTARRLNPRSVNVLVSLADLLAALGRYTQALAAANDALALDKSSPAALFQKGRAHQSLNALDRAAAAFREAVHLDPRAVDALSALANLAALQGRAAEARDHARRALALRPADAIAALAIIRADMAERRYDDAAPRLQSLLTFATDPEIRAIALGYLGDVRDAQGDIEAAFAAYRDSGAAWRALHAPRVAGQESARDQAMRLTAAIEALPSGSWRSSGTLPKPKGDGSKGIAFILGFPRTGTTVLARILATLPDIAILEEKPIFAKAVADFLGTKDGIARLAALSDFEIGRCRDEVWRRIADTGVDTAGKFVIDQNALNTAYLPVILRLFPEAKIVFALRDPRDVVFSSFRRQFGANLFTLELSALDSAAAYYAAAMQLADACRTRLGAEVLELRNEDLIADFDSQTQRLCSHLGLPWDTALRDFGRDTTIATISAQQVRRGLSTEGVGHWRRYAAQLAPVLPGLSPWLRRFGYGD